MVCKTTLSTVLILLLSACEGTADDASKTSVEPLDPAATRIREPEPSAEQPSASAPAAIELPPIREWQLVEVELVDGSSEAEGITLRETSDLFQHRMELKGIEVNDGVVVFAISAKPLGRSKIRLRINSDYAFFDLGTGELLLRGEGVEPGIEKGTEGWYRIWMSCEPANSTVDLRVNLENEDLDPEFAGDDRESLALTTPSLTYAVTTDDR